MRDTPAIKSMQVQTNIFSTFIRPYLKNKAEKWEAKEKRAISWGTMANPGLRTASLRGWQIHTFLSEQW